MRDYCVAKSATLREAQGRPLRAARLEPSLREERWFGMTILFSFRLQIILDDGSVTLPDAAAT